MPKPSRDISTGNIGTDRIGSSGPRRTGAGRGRTGGNTGAGAATRVAAGAGGNAAAGVAAASSTGAADTPRAKEPRSYHHGDLRNALIAHGLGLLEEHGIAALSLREIAARAGVSHAAPKNHFGNLRGLLTAMAAEGFRRHAAAMRGGLPARATRSRRLLAAMDGYVGFATAHPHLFSLMFSGEHCDLADPELGAAAADSYAVLREIAAGLDWEHADAPDAAMRAEMMLWSLVHGYAVLSLGGLFAGPQRTGGRLPAIGDVMPRFDYRR